MFNNIKKFIILVLIVICIATTSKGATSGVNKYAWEASLKTINFMPLISANPNSGVIITDWYNITPETRYKVDIYVLNGILNAQSVKVSVFKQVKQKDSWIYTEISSKVANNIEDAILNLAKKLRATSY